MTKRVKKNKKIVNETSEEKYLSTFFITLGLLLVFILIVYFISDFVLKEEEILKSVTLNVDSNEILASNIFDVADDNYYVIVYNSKKDTLGMVSYITQQYEDKNIYVVDLAKTFNKNIISNTLSINTSDINEFKVKNEAIIKIKDGKNIESIDVIGKYKSFFE